MLGHVLSDLSWRDKEKNTAEGHVSASSRVAQGEHGMTNQEISFTVETGSIAIALQRCSTCGSQQNVD